MKKQLSVFLLLLIVSICTAAVTFVNQPSLLQVDGGFNAHFEISSITDVEVSIVREATGEIVRHLAAGVLGANAPHPLQKNTLSQTIFWDGLDDFGNSVADGSVCKLRVRAGMSPVLDKMVGEQPHAFHRSINGITVNNNGKLFVFGSYPRPSHHGTTMMTLRRYARNGDYEKTLWPVPAGLSVSSVQPFGIVMQPGGGYLPRTEAGDVPQFGGTPLSYEESAMLPTLIDNAALIYDLRDFRYFLVNQDGSILDTNRLIKQPELPLKSQYYGPWPSGPVYLSLSPDKKFYLLSGYSAKHYDSTVAGWWPSDTGFWKEGQVFRINAATGQATPFVSIPTDSLPRTVAERRAIIGPFYTSTSITFMSAFHGTAFDEHGRVYVCDRVRKEVGVYDTTGMKLGSLPVVDPDVVAVSAKTGAVYVMSRQYTAYQIGTSSLTRFKSWNDTSRMVLKKTSLTKTSAVEDERKGPVPFTARIYINIDDSGEKTRIWVNTLNGPNALVDSSVASVRAFEDDGVNITRVYDFWNNARGQSSGYDRVVVDRKSETVFINDSWDVMSKITNWENPVIDRCRTSLGAYLNAADMAVSPDGKFLYISKFTYPNHPILRYTLDSLHAPAIFSAKGTNIAVDGVKQRYGAGTSDRGITVTSAGLIYAMTSQDSLLIFDTTGARINDTLLRTQVSAGGIRSDLKGNLYVGMLLRSPEHVIPTEYQSYSAYVKGAGSVVKMKIDTQVNVLTNNTLTLRVPVGASKVYPQAISPFSNAYISTVRVPSSSASCVCRRPRYDVDHYGRLFLPNTVIAQVTVADNEGNTITTFGSYGNVDSKGAGSMIPEPAIPFAWPSGVAASEDYIYVTDLINARLVRIKMAYELNNMPGFSVRQYRPSDIAYQQVAMKLSPNPFNPDCRIDLTLSEKSDITIKVFTADGKFVKKLSSGAVPAGKCSFKWDGLDLNGVKASAGIYLFRLTTHNHSLTVKGVLAR